LNYETKSVLFSRNIIFTWKNDRKTMIFFYAWVSDQYFSNWIKWACNFKKKYVIWAVRIRISGNVSAHWELGRFPIVTDFFIIVIFCDVVKWNVS
jgi:hypothetical protein